LDGLFNLGFQNLGGFEACIFDHAASKTIDITAYFGSNGSYGLRLGKVAAKITAGNDILELTADVPIPYGANQSWPFAYSENEEEFTITGMGLPPRSPQNQGRPRARPKRSS
jgi:hypothetical protein